MTNNRKRQRKFFWQRNGVLEFAAITDIRKMAVTIASHKTPEPKRAEISTKRHALHYYNTRPITATLEHPLILDIKLLKKLDMTTFTKKGLIALSKFCGISLINKPDAKKKRNRTIQYSKKQTGTDFTGAQTADASKRAKRKLAKQMSKAKPRLRFKMAVGDSSPDEDALDVVCKSDGEVVKTLNRMTNAESKQRDRKTVIGSAVNGTVDNVIPEPCKTCSRSEQPERFHSHPKVVRRLAVREKSEGKREEEEREEEGKECGGEKKEEMKKSTSAKESESKSPQKQFGIGRLQQEFQVCDEKKTQSSSKPSTRSPTKSSSSTEISSPGTKNKPKTLRSPFTSQSSPKSKDDAAKRPSKPAPSPKGDKTSGEDAMKFVTGCYICGKQLSPKSRMKHEKSCIEEWRSQNVVQSGDRRRVEPKRPDFRFTASGDLDYEGTFESIWANHMDSLVPCKKCGRTFFPDRIERHENCCNNVPVSVKYKH